MRGTWFGVALCIVFVLYAQSAFGETAVTPSTPDVKIKASHDFGNYKMGEYNKRLVIGCAIEDSSYNFRHTWKWYHNDQEVNMDYVTPHPFIVSGNLLIISYLNDSTVGKYTCKLFSGKMLDKDIGANEINVIMKPTLDINRVQIFNLGEPLALKCLVEAAPAPTITWEFENTTILPSDDVWISTDANGNSILHINATTNQHTGQYYCVGQYATILPPVRSEPCYVFSEDNLEEFVKMTATLEAEWDAALEAASKADVQLHVAKARFLNSVLWLKLTGKWTRADERWIDPFQQNLLESDLAVIAAKTATLVSSTRALESRDRNADPNTHVFAMADEVAKLAAAGQDARKLETLLSEEVADVNWLMEAVALKTADRKASIVVITQPDNQSKFNVVASISQ